MSGLIRHLAVDMHPFVVAFHRALFGLIWMLPWIVRHGGRVLRTGRRCSTASAPASSWSA